MKTILMLGAGVMQEPAIRIARAKGWRLIIVDGNPDAPARDRGDCFELMDLKDRDGLLRVAQSHSARTGLDGIFTAGTDFSSSVAWVAERMGLPGIPYATAMRATDKCLMREAFARAGVPSPRFACWTGATDPRALLGNGMDFPLVVKPVDNMGARGVKRVDEPAQLADACREALLLSRSSRVIIERFMEGPELSLDAVVYKGEITICGVADRHICFPPSFVEMGHTMPTDLEPAAVRAIEEAFRAGIRAIGIDNGAAKGDIKLTPAGPMIGEIAARLSGGYMSGWTFPLSSGVEVTEAALNIAVGLPPGNLAPTRHRTCAERALISMPGTVAELTGVEEAWRAPGVAEVFLRVKAGDEVVFPENNVQKCGNILAVADERAQAVAAAQAALSCILIRLRPLAEKTTRHLFARNGNDAFAALSPETRRAIQGMPPYTGKPSTHVPGMDVRVALPDFIAKEGSRDWYGCSLVEAARRACRDGHGTLQALPGREPFSLAGLFWRAVSRAGSQGGVYLLDSVREAARQGRLEEFLGAL
jgi:biotin carboxylase